MEGGCVSCDESLVAGVLLHLEGCCSCCCIAVDLDGASVVPGWPGRTTVNVIKSVCDRCGSGDVFSSSLVESSEDKKIKSRRSRWEKLSSSISSISESNSR